MTKFNSYETKTQGVYGNGSETIFVNKFGKAFIVQSPDMQPGVDATPTDNYLPVDMVSLGMSDVSDLEIPEWVYEAR
jgi:hypothetical protein